MCHQEHPADSVRRRSAVSPEGFPTDSNTPTNARHLVISTLRLSPLKCLVWKSKHGLHCRCGDRKEVLESRLTPEVRTAHASRARAVAGTSALLRACCHHFAGTVEGPGRASVAEGSSKSPSSLALLVIAVLRFSRMLVHGHS